MEDTIKPCTPKISVIIPIYGVEKYIEKCAQSLFEQTLDHIEFIFIDDCTPDNSIKLLEQIIEKNNSHIIEKKWIVRVERMPANGGQAAVRKYGLQLASGDYIINCDSDDWVEPDMYETLYNKAITDNVDLVFCDYYINSETEERIFSRNQIDYNNKDEVFRYTIISNYLNPVWGALAKKELYEKVNCPKGSQSEDSTFMIQLVYYSNSMSHTSKQLYHYRLNPTSITHSVDVRSIVKRYKDIESNRLIIKDFANKNNLLNRYKLEFQAFFFLSKRLLTGYLFDEKCRELWKSSFPDSNRKILLNPYVTLKNKLYFLKCRIELLFYR